jgi:hypothetical protein
LDEFVIVMEFQATTAYSSFWVHRGVVFRMEAVRSREGRDNIVNQVQCFYALIKYVVIVVMKIELTV